MLPVNLGPVVWISDMLPVNFSSADWIIDAIKTVKDPFLDHELYWACD